MVERVVRESPWLKTMRAFDLLVHLSSPGGPTIASDKIGSDSGLFGAGAAAPWLQGLIEESPKVRLVRTQRLDIEEHTEVDEEGTVIVPKPTVEIYSEELSVHIRQTLAAYAARSQELDRTFPVRLLGPTKAEPLTAEDLRERMAELEQKRARLTSLGFLEPEQGLEQAPVRVIETKRDVLTVYVEDVESKLAVFDAMAAKIQIFTRIINGRFLFKRLEIHRDEGFVFTSATGARLKPAELSSGEQHELVLLYELLFKLQKNALVLLDEPEISLHVAWQEKFLEDLMEVVKLSEIDVVVATHSPEIIGEHWDLTVGLKGPPETREG
jgi:predicted ATP-binding protein involved in virulence